MQKPTSHLKNTRKESSLLKRSTFIWKRVTVLAVIKSIIPQASVEIDGR
jgi:hypothetical protein